MGLCAYHEATKHSLESLARGPHVLDFGNQPVPFRRYVGIELAPLPRRLEAGSVPLEATVLPGGPGSRGRDLPDRAALGRILHYSMGILRTRRLPDGRRIDFRAAPCTGALYHVDAWLVCGDLVDLPAGVYHFAPDGFGLRRLHDHDFRGVLVEASGDAPGIGNAPATLVLASTWWRNAWKYRDRAYRHVFWDTGTILAQLLAIARADDWPVGVVTGFADGVVSRLLGLDSVREGPVAIVPIGEGRPAPMIAAPEPLVFPLEPLSPAEEHRVMILEAHRASSLETGDEAIAWREAGQAGDALLPKPEAGGVPLPDVPGGGGDALERVILRRGSARVFARASISRSALARILAFATAPVPEDVTVADDPSVLSLYIVVNAVGGVPPGAYRWDPRNWSLCPIAAGDFREPAGRMALGQALAADAAVNLYAIADLDRLFDRLGERGYRTASLDAAIGGGRAYLAAYGMGLGATGLTFFDDEVCRFFRLEPRRYAVMFLTAAGVPARPR